MVSDLEGCMIAYSAVSKNREPYFA